MQGGPAMLAALVVVLGVAQAAFSARLSLLHRVFTPVVTGTVIMLVPVTVMPILFRMLNELPPGAPPRAGPLSAGSDDRRHPGDRAQGDGSRAPLGSGRRNRRPVRWSADSSESTTRQRWRMPPGSALRRAGCPGWTLTSAPRSGDSCRRSCSWRPGGLGQVGRRRGRRPALGLAPVSRAVDFRAVQGAVAAEGAGQSAGGSRRNDAQYTVCWRAWPPSK